MHLPSCFLAIPEDFERVAVLPSEEDDPGKYVVSNN